MDAQAMALQGIRGEEVVIQKMDRITRKIF